MTNTTSENATVSHERLIKRSTVIERRLAGNVFCTVAIDKEDRIIGCGCKKLLKFPNKGYVSLFTDTLTVMAAANDRSGFFNSLTPCDYELMPYRVFGLTQNISAYKVIEYSGSVIAELSYNGRVTIRGDYECGEWEADGWEQIDDLVLFEGGVLGVTKDGDVKLCGEGAKPYLEMLRWKDVARVKKIHTGYVGFVSEGFIGLKKDGTLLYCGRDRNFAQHISSYKNIVSFDACAVDGEIDTFWGVRSDGRMFCYDSSGDYRHKGLNYLAVKILPSGPHFIKADGTVDAIPLKETYPKELKDALITLTGKNYDAVYEAMRSAATDPLANRAIGWKLFDDPDEVLRRYEGIESGSFAREKKCLYCGGDKQGFLIKRCTVCGRKS